MPEQARVSDLAKCDADAHGCPSCPHPPIGPGICGEPTVLVNGLAALRFGDPGIHALCCGPNTWNVNAGSATVIIGGEKAARKGDATKHCGGAGTLKTGSGDVITGG